MRQDVLAYSTRSILIVEDKANLNSKLPRFTLSDEGRRSFKKKQVPNDFKKRMEHIEI